MSMPISAQRKLSTVMDNVGCKSQNSARRVIELEFYHVDKKLTKEIFSQTDLYLVILSSKRQNDQVLVTLTGYFLLCIILKQWFDKKFSL